MPLYLPSEIWNIMIGLAYPINNGLDKKFLDLARVSKTFNRLVKKLFILYLKNPVFNDDPKYIKRDTIINYLIKDLPIVEPGFVTMKTNHLTPFNKYSDHGRFKFTFRNCRTNQNFSNSDFINKRLLVANCYSRNRTRKLERVTYITEIDHPIIIIPFIDTDHNNINAVFYIQKIYYCDKYLTYLEIAYDRESNALNTSDINLLEKDFHEDSEIFFFKLLDYVKDPINPIPNKINEFVNQILQDNKL